MKGEAVRARWSLARLTLLHNHRSRGIQDHQDVHCDFQALGMRTDAAMVALDLAEYFLEDGRAADAAAMLRGALADLEASGVRESVNRALRDLVAAAEHEVPDVTYLRQVRRFIARSHTHPCEEFQAVSSAGNA